MKEFKMSLKYVIFSQLFLWIAFILCNKNFYFGVILLVILSILYFGFRKKIITKNELNSKKFNIFLLINWIIISILITFFIHNLDKCTSTTASDITECSLYGVEYDFYMCLMIFLLFPITLVGLIAKLFKEIKEKLKK